MLITVSGKVPFGNLIGFSVFLQSVKEMEMSNNGRKSITELINPGFFIWSSFKECINTNISI